MTDRPGGPRRPLLLTGGPAVGKSATARAVAATRERAAVIDVDDIRQLVVSGHRAPWQGDDGAAQQRIGIENAADITRRLVRSGFDVVLCDVVEPATVDLYRGLLPDLVIIRLYAPMLEVRRRAGLRPVHLTDEEFDDLHRRDAAIADAVDHMVDVGRMTPEEQCSAVLAMWTA